MLFHVTLLITKLRVFSISKKNDFNCFPTGLKLKEVQVYELILVDRLGNPF